MPNITLSISEDLHKVVKEHNEIKWSEIARRAISEQATKLKLMDKLVEKSKFTEKDALELGRKINKSLHERYTQ